MALKLSMSTTNILQHLAMILAWPTVVDSAPVRAPLQDAMPTTRTPTATNDARTREEAATDARIPRTVVSEAHAILRPVSAEVVAATAARWKRFASSRRWLA